MNPYINTYNPQASVDRINAQIGELEKLKAQIPQQPMAQPITQNFQLAPNPTNNELESKYVNNIDEVKGIFVMKTGVFLNKELNTLWIKNTNGDIRTFELNELVEIDPKDREITMLKQELEKMKERISNESNGNSTVINEPNESKTTTKLSNRSKSNAK